MSTVVPISREVAMTQAGADVTRPCPFCSQLGNLGVCDEDGYDENDVLGTYYWVACGQCECEGPKADSAALAAAAWNHRAPI